jgi:hypothetical protein
VAVRALAEAKPVQPDLAAFRSECANATQTCVAAVEKAFGSLQQSIQTSLERLEQAVVSAAAASRPGPTVDVSPLLGALKAAIEKSTAALNAASDGPAKPPAPAAAQEPGEELGNAIVEAVDDWG